MERRGAARNLGYSHPLKRFGTAIELIFELDALFCK